jgi:hypothetical protein
MIIIHTMNGDTLPRLAAASLAERLKRAGLLLHMGSTLEQLAPDVLAAPWWRVS